MTDDEIRAYLEDNGYPPHVVEAGREGLIRRYLQFVDEVERGYEYTLQSYRHDLDGRAILEMAGVSDEIRDADERLARLLVQPEIRVWESLAGEPFWDFGFPANARGSMLRGLRTEGLLEG